MQQPQYSYPSRQPDVDTSVVIQLAEELKNVPFNMTPHGAYGVARHAVAQLLSPDAAGYPSNPQGEPDVLDSANVDANLRLIGELRAEVAALKAAMALTIPQRLMRACIALGSAAKKLSSSENVDGLGDRLEREAKFCSGKSADELDLLSTQPWPSAVIEAAQAKLAYALELVLVAREAPFAGDFAKQAYADTAEALLQQTLRAAVEVTAGDTPSAAQVREAVRDAVIAGLSNTYYCGRTWSAWQVGTMHQQDFTPAAEVSEVVDEITDAALAALGR